MDCFLNEPGSSTVSGNHYGKLAAMKRHYELAQRHVDRVLSQPSQAREAGTMSLWPTWLFPALDLGTPEPFRYVLPTPSWLASHTSTAPKLLRLNYAWCRWTALPWRSSS